MGFNMFVPRLQSLWIMLLYIYIYIYIYTRFKHNLTPDMLFHLESLEKKQIVNMRETKLDHRNYHDFDK